MKKTLSLLLALLMLLSSSIALAQDYTLDRKLQLQLLNGSGLKAKAQLSVTPELQMTALDAATNNLLAALLPNAELELNYIRSTSANRGQEDLNLLLKRGGAQVASLHYGTDGILEILGSSLLGGQSLVSLRGDGRILGLFSGKALSTWPGLERAIFAVQNSDNVWRAKAETLLKPYLDRLSLWLQPYTKISTEKDAGGKQITVNTVTIPASAFKTQMKQMLAELYRDTEMMNHLRQLLSASEVVAYLQPTMLPGIQAAIDQLKLTGDITVSRRYDQAGSLIKDELDLPMAGAQGLERVRYSFAADQAGVEKGLIELIQESSAGAMSTGWSLSFEGGRPSDAQEGEETLSYTGTLTISPKVDEKSFTVEGEAKPLKVFDYNFYRNTGKEAYDEASKISTQEHELTLLLKPRDIEGLGDQRISMTAKLSSALGDGKATHATGKLVWQDMSTQSAITADYSGSSAAPWVIPTVNTAGAVRLDAMTQEQLNAQKTRVQVALTTAIAGLAQALLVPKTP